MNGWIVLTIWLIGAVIFGGVIHAIVDEDAKPAVPAGPAPILGLFWPILIPVGLFCMLFIWGTRGVSYLIKKGVKE